MKMLDKLGNTVQIFFLQSRSIIEIILHNHQDSSWSTTVCSDFSQLYV